MRVFIKEAIHSGAWFSDVPNKHAQVRCKVATGGGFESRLKEMPYRERKETYRFRVLSFEKGGTNMAHIPNDGVIWSLKLEFINLLSSPVNEGPKLYLIDQYGSEYYSYSSELSSILLNPKIKYTGQIMFLLPNNDEADYYMGFRGSEV